VKLLSFTGATRNEKEVVLKETATQPGIISVATYLAFV
jgi:hypothetical protein